MNYFILKESIIISEIGDFPQVEPFYRRTYYVWDENKIYGINLWDSIHPDLELPDFKLRKKSKLTDILSSAALNTRESLFISENARNNLKEYFYEGISEFIVNVYDQNNNPYIFYYEYLNKIDNDFIDFEKSIFVAFDESHELPRRGTPIKFTNGKEYTKYFRELKTTTLLTYHKIILDYKKINKEIFRIKGTYGGIMVSENVVNTLVRESLSGFQFESIDVLLNNPIYLAGHYTIE